MCVGAWLCVRGSVCMCSPTCRKNDLTKVAQHVFFKETAPQEITLLILRDLL